MSSSHVLPISRQSQRGFTLLELAVVLTIIGLIMGSILIGQTMIRSSELNSIISDRSQYMASLANFRMRYHATPGDMNNATMFWGTASSCPGGIAPGTCNGNNNGRVQLGGAWTSPGEQYRLWEHMSLAEMIPGKYTGVPASNSDVLLTFAEGTMPRSRTGGNFSIEYRQYTTGEAKNRLVLYGLHPNTGNLSPDDASYLDGKLDDGLPSRGILRSYGPTSSNCITTISGNEVYQLGENFSGCFVVIDIE
jgi:prepilin-type N-terminal cleavage/methylation domain-containing protein